MRKLFLLITIVAIIFLLCSCNNSFEKEHTLIYDSKLTNQELVDSIKQNLPQSIYIEVDVYVEDDYSNMIMSKYNNIVVTESYLSDGVSVISVYDYNINKAYQYFKGDSLSEEEKTYGMELTLTNEEIEKGIDYQFEALSGIGEVEQAYVTEYEGYEAIYIKSVLRYDESELVFTIYLSTKFSYPLYMSSLVDGKESVKMIVTKIDDNYLFSETFPDIPEFINFVNYDDL